MNNRAVKRSDLEHLIWFLNLSEQVIQTWVRDAPKPDAMTKEQEWDWMLMHRRLFMLTGPRDDAQTLIQLRQDLSSDIAALLNPDKSADEALKKLLERIDKMKLAGFRRLLTKEEQLEREKKGYPFSVVDLMRVSPPAPGEKGRRKPIIESLSITEGRYDESARENFYRIVDDAIRNNTISEIRCCLNCATYFLRDGRRLTYCSPSCETKFNNQRRIEAGYFKVRTKPVEEKEKPLLQDPK